MIRNKCKAELIQHSTHYYNINIRYNVHVKNNTTITLNWRVFAIIKKHVMSKIIHFEYIYSAGVNTTTMTHCDDMRRCSTQMLWAYTHGALWVERWCHTTRYAGADMRHCDNINCPYRTPRLVRLTKEWLATVSIWLCSRSLQSTLYTYIRFKSV